VSVSDIILTPGPLNNPARPVAKLTCEYCGKNYKRRENFVKHVFICKHLSETSKRGSIAEDFDACPPTNHQLYEMILSLSKKCDRLEKTVDDQQKWINCKKRKIKVVEWLNANVSPPTTFFAPDPTNNIVVEVTSADIVFLFDHSFIETINRVLVREVYELKDRQNLPVIAYVQKPGVVYIYTAATDKTDPKTDPKTDTAPIIPHASHLTWVEMTNADLTACLNTIQSMFIQKICEWKRDNREMVASNETAEFRYQTSLIKITNADFKKPSLISKIRQFMFGRVKTDIAVMVEYEF